MGIEEGNKILSFSLLREIRQKVLILRDGMFSFPLRETIKGFHFRFSVGLKMGKEKEEEEDY